MGAAPEIFKNNISVPTMVALARARRHLDSVGAGDVTLILSEMSLSDLTTWKRNVAELTGIPFAGVTGIPPEERRRDRIRSRPS